MFDIVPPPRHLKAKRIKIENFDSKNAEKPGTDQLEKTHPRSMKPTQGM